jgi:hypothetical protein
LENFFRCAGRGQMMILPDIHIPLNIMKQGSSPENFQIGLFLFPDLLAQAVNTEHMGQSMHRIIFRVISPDFLYRWHNTSLQYEFVFGVQDISLRQRTRKNILGNKKVKGNSQKDHNTQREDFFGDLKYKTQHN